MNLLEAVNAACDSVALDRFSVLVGNVNENALTMIRFAQEAGEEISRRGDWQKMLKTASVTASPFVLPVDFQRLVPGGIMTATGTFARMILNGGQWSIVAPTTAGAYTFIRDGALLFAPPSSAVGATVQYVSTQWLAGVGGNVSQITADDNAPLFPARLLTSNLIWRWRRQKGVTYEDELAEFEAALAIELAADRGAVQ